MQNILATILFLAIGFALGLLSRSQARNGIPIRWQIGIPENLADALTTFVIFVSLPALILYRVPTLEISTDLLVPVVMPWIMLAFSAAMVVAVSALINWTKSVKGLLLLLVPLGNTSFLGIPMVETFFGEEHVVYALLYDQLGTFLGLATYGAVITGLYGGNHGSGERSPLRNTILLKIAAFPPFIALLLAFVIRPVTLHPVITSTLGVLSDTLVPLVMIAVGFKIRFTIARTHRLPLAVGLALKLVAAPLVALAGCRLLGLSGNAADVAVFESGMPPMIAAWAVAMKAGLEPELGAALVSLGILLSFVTLPFLFQLL